MKPRRPGDQQPDRLARLLMDVDREDGAGGTRPVGGARPVDGTRPVDGATLEDLLDGPEETPPDRVLEEDPEPVLEDALRGGRHREGRVPLLSVPVSLRSAEVAVGPRAVRGLLVLVVVTALVLGGRWVWAQLPAQALAGRQVVEPAAEEVVEEAAGGEAESSSGGTAAPGPGETAEGVEGVEAGEAGADAQDVVVHVTGQVRDPGVVELPAGARVVDAVRAAGGLTAKADHSSVNLARVLVDGEQLWVGRPGEEPPAGWSPPPVPGGTPGSASADGEKAPPLDLNAATQADLEELPGVGPVTAGHILAWRDEHGSFSRVDELLEVSGIGERTLAQLEPLVTVGG